MPVTDDALAVQQVGLGGAIDTQLQSNTAIAVEQAEDRITSYNVCYTKLLRR